MNVELKISSDEKSEFSEIASVLSLLGGGTVVIGTQEVAKKDETPVVESKKRTTKEKTPEKPKETVETKTEEVQEDIDETEESVTIDDCKKAYKPLMPEKREQVKAVFEQLGTSSLSKLEESKYPEFIKLIKAIK